MSEQEVVEKSEVRAQRHAFILEYYKMAVRDLDRHLKGGWETIAVLAGGAAVLSVGHDGKIYLPIAIAMAIAIAWWGALVALDANYWAVRAIAFLANVEAVYFAIEDRKYFNPYAGSHPPYKLLDSLRYNIWIFSTFAVLCILDLGWEASGRGPGLLYALEKTRVLDWLTITLWATPLLVFLWGVVLLFATYHKRLKDYLAFSKASPGPPMVMRTGDPRHVDLSAVSGEAAAEAQDVQERGIRRLEAQDQAMDNSLPSRMASIAAIAFSEAALVLAIISAVLGASRR